METDDIEFAAWFEKIGRELEGEFKRRSEFGEVADCLAILADDDGEVEVLGKM